jgi:hypothetical protein
LHHLNHFLGLELWNSKIGKKLFLLDGVTEHLEYPIRSRESYSKVVWNITSK